MARIGSAVERLNPDELRKRSITIVTVEAVDDPFDSAWVWNKLPGVKLKTAPTPSAKKQRITRPFCRIFRWVLARLHLPLPHWLLCDAPTVIRLQGLKQAIEQTHITAPAIHDGVDIAHLAVPFCHYSLCTHYPLTFDVVQTAEYNLNQSFIQHFGRYATTDIRFQYTHLEDASALNVHFGFGVFVPDPGDSKVGSFEIQAMANGSPWVALKFMQAQEAAFYSGQKGIAFSNQVQYTPAYDHNNILPVDHVFYFGVLSENPTATELRFDSYHIDELIGAPKPGAVGKSHFSIKGGAAALRQEGKPIVVLQDSQPAFRFRWFGTAGTHALRPYPPTAATGKHYLVLQELLLPECTRTTNISSWWIEFTETGRFASHLFGGRAFALHATGQGVQLYDRQHGNQSAKDFDGRSQIGDMGCWFGEVEPDIRNAFWYWRLRSLETGGFGLVPLDQLAHNATVTATQTQQLSAFPIDWINACSHVVPRTFWDFMPLKSERGEQYSGLASHCFDRNLKAAKNTPQIQLMLNRREASLSLQCKHAPVATQHQKQGFQTGNTHTLQPGDELIIGCYRFRYQVMQEVPLEI